MADFASRTLRAIVVCSVAAGLVIACGSEGASTFDNGGNATEDAGPQQGSLGGGDNVDGGPVVGSLCKPRTCAEQGIECGPSGDGCGGIIADCGKCGAGLRCGGPNALSKCVSPLIGTACMPKTCADVNVECGLAGDGCGGILTCGTCPSGQQCGATGAPSKCVAAVPTSLDGGACAKKTCADYKLQNMDCGQQSDGCGSTIDCGLCTAPEFCGGGGPSKCAVTGGGTCTPKTCTNYPGTCGPQPNGCGGVTVSCGTCADPQVCGGGGVPSVCGGGSTQGSDGGACVPSTTCGPQQCGKVADGCGGVLDCGTAACTNGTICGGGGTPNVCGAPACAPITQCPVGKNCGAIADGCGGLVQCGNGTCSPPQICGGGGQSNVCGGGGIAGDGGAACQPMTCAQTGKQCGPVADGCGGITDCPICASPAVCGGGGVPSMCGGANQCTPKTVADCPANGCGFIADGCGGLVQCGATCPNGGVCGVTTANVCGGGAGGTCTGFCLNQDNTCAANSKTRITGKIYAPNGTLPLPGALVYVPNGDTKSPWGVTSIASGVANGGTCEQCNQQASGSPLVSTTSAFDGSFTLNDVPAGVSFPLVIQLGKWRRMITVGAVTKCTSATLDGSNNNRPLARLPVRQNEGANGVDNIPLVAISTGSVDGLECVFKKLGLTTKACSGGSNAGNPCTKNSNCPGGGTCGDTLNQFGNPVGTSTLDRGRIRLYRDNDSGSAKGGASIDDNTPKTDSALTDTQAHLDQYDAVIFGCAGARNDRTTAILDRVRGYADKGGRVFATHFEYVYLYNRTPWDVTAAWDVPNARSSGDGSWTGEVNTGSAKRLLFSQWLGAPGVAALSATNPPRLNITEARNNVDRPVATGSEEWITRYNDSPPSGGNAVLHYTFNTPWAAAPANQCGRVLFSDFHVTLGNTSGETFPNECDNGGLTDQEKVLAFFLFDLTSCIQTPAPPTCTAKTCANYPAGTCGVQSDGCNGITANCGTCPNGQTCGGGGVLNQCGGPTCTPKTCIDLGAQCGVIPDGCGNTVNCPNCPAGQTCGGGGVANKCGVSSCTPKTCQEQGIQCGQTGDGCGNVISCPACPGGTTCGGGGVPNQCGAPACTPITQCPPGKNCGMYPDGCGGAINCGTCPGGQTCGGGGAPNVCGAASCSPKTCAQQGAQCGSVSDQCGGVVQCPACPAGDFCNGQNQCISPDCKPKTCQQLGVECGPTANTCGGLVQCGDCPPGMGCGAAGVPGKCGKIPCTPRTCNDLGATCGQVADGCGNLTPNCGDCTGALSCKNGVCVDACKPRTCAEAGANCGPVSDGCGSLVDCGQCPGGQTCGFNGHANICGADGPK